MWLDRFSAHSTPAPSPPPHSRPYSPAPRRSATLAQSRPVLSARSSSLSLISNSSATNLPGATKPSTSSALKNQLDASPPPDVEDPVEALERVIGVAATHAKENGTRQSDDEPLELVEDIDFRGLSLEQFAAAPNAQQNGFASAPAYSEKSAGEYEKERDKFEELHRSIIGCDDVLKSVESYLTSFQNDLGSVSSAIEMLQSRSASLNKQLDTRRQVEKVLGPAVEQVTISPATVRKISEGPVDDGWVHALADLRTRVRALEAAEQQPDKPKALDDFKPLIDSLSDRAVERIRDYFAAQIKAIRSPNINAQVIQQQGFLRFAPLYSFIAVRQPQLADDLYQAYTNTMRWYYQSLFSRYHAALSKLKLYSTDRHDVLGEDPSSKPRSTNPTPALDTFSLARRVDIIRQPSSSALPSHVAEETKQPQYLETPFLAYNLALIDNASFEYTFLTHFFASPTSNGDPTNQQKHATRHFHAIFEPVFTLGQSLTKSLTSESYDALGILMCVRLTQHFAFILQRRRTPALDSYINATHMALWPRFQLVLDAHADSLKRLAAALPSSSKGSGNAAAASLSSSAAAANGPSTAPNPVTQRFANFVHGVLSLSAESRGDDEPVSASLARLRAEFEAVLAKMGAQFGPGDRGRRERERFLSNNYSLVCAILADAGRGAGAGGGGGKLVEEVRGHFEELRAAHRS